MFEKILIATDFSPASKQALHCGNELAWNCDSEVVVLYVLTFLANADQATRHVVPGADWLTVFRRELKEFVKDEPNSKRTLEILVHDNASTEIIKYSKEHRCKLIVVGSHGHSSLVNTLLGSTTQKLMRNSNIPVMIVPSKTKIKKEFSFRNILVPIDFSEISLKSLKLGSQMADYWNSILHVIHVVDLKAVWDSRKADGVIDLKELDVSSTLHSMVTGVEFTRESRVSTLHGDPQEEILKYAKEHNIDFIVMGSHGRKGLDRVLVGSTTASIVRYAEIPIITMCEHSTVQQEK